MGIHAEVLITQKELAIACCKAKQCRFCKSEVKAVCLQDECWKATYPKDNMPPAVYYGLIPPSPNRLSPDNLGWRHKWFADRGLPYESPRPIKNLFVPAEG